MQSYGPSFTNWFRVHIRALYNKLKKLSNHHKFRSIFTFLPLEDRLQFLGGYLGRISIIAFRLTGVNDFYSA